jgi:hypothetical protein
MLRRSCRQLKAQTSSFFPRCHPRYNTCSIDLMR